MPGFRCWFASVDYHFGKQYTKRWECGDFEFKWTWPYLLICPPVCTGIRAACFYFSWKCWYIWQCLSVRNHGTKKHFWSLNSNLIFRGVGLSISHFFTQSVSHSVSHSLKFLQSILSYPSISIYPFSAIHSSNVEVMSMSWPRHGQVLAKSWPSHGQVMSKSWPCHGQVMAKSWLSNLWQSYW